MKKSIIALLSILICLSTISYAEAKNTTSNSSLASAIKLYKTGNYSQTYDVLHKIVAKDPSNAVACYYLAMTSAQIGRKNEAIENYAKVISLAPNSKLSDYAIKGKTCIETPDKCNAPVDEGSAYDKFIRSAFGNGFSTEAKGEYEKKKIENMMREMNRKDDLSPSKFKEFKDYSGEVPTNDEIVAAIRILQNAGLGNIVGNNNYNPEFSYLTGNTRNDNYEMLNLLLGNKNSNSSLSPQVIQSLLTNQMSAGF